jgi:hypothetical protein
LIQLRRLIRAAGKESLRLTCVVEGSIEKEVHCSHAGMGPVSYREQENLHIFVSSGGSWTIARLRQLDHRQELDIPSILDQLRRGLRPGFLPSGSEVHPSLQFEHQNEAPLDPKLLDMDEQEYGDFFRSRFLIDAPRKMLYEGNIAVGARYFAYMDDHIPLLFEASTVFSIEATLRTRKIWVKATDEGNTIRQMRLAKIRPKLSLFWRDNHVELNHEELPSTIILNHHCLSVLAYELQEAVLRNDPKVWSWLRAYPKELQNQFSLKISEHSHDETHPMLQMLDEVLSIHEHPRGELKEELGELLNAEAGAREALYFQDIVVELNLGEFHVVSRGSGLLLQGNGQDPVQFSGPIYFKLKGEDVQEALASCQTHLYRPFGRPVLSVPDYCILEDIRPRLLSKLK